MGQCLSHTPGIPYMVEPESELGMVLFSISNTEAYNRGFGSRSTVIQGVKGATHPKDYLPLLKQKKKKRRYSQNDSSCRLIHFYIAMHGNPTGVSAKILLTTKSPRISKTSPPTLDILFQDRTKVRVGYQRMPTTDDNEYQASWMATSIHFNNMPFAKYRIQMTRSKFPFVVQLFENQTQQTCASLLTFGPDKRRPRIMHAFYGNVDSCEKAESSYYSHLFGVLDENKGSLAFQNALSNDIEKATLCIMLLMRVRLLTFNGSW